MNFGRYCLTFQCLVSNKSFWSVSNSGKTFERFAWLRIQLILENYYLSFSSGNGFRETEWFNLPLNTSHHITTIELPYKILLNFISNYHSAFVCWINVSSLAFVFDKFLFPFTKLCGSIIIIIKRIYSIIRRRFGEGKIIFV